MEKLDCVEITILVLCFNSAATVVETLNSCKVQTYKNIHLVVSDDSSTDNTYEIVENWIKKHRNSFLSCKVLKTKTNLGVSRHMNVCMKEIQTEWFKGLAADDILLPDCIEKYVRFIQSHVCHGMVYANHLSFLDNDNGRKYFIDYEEIMYQKYFNTLSADRQRKIIAKRELLCSPTCFTNKNDMLAVGGYDVRIKNIEDWPAKMKLTANGYKMNRMNEFTVLYRVGNSVSRCNDLYFKPEHLKLEKKIKKLYCYPVLRKSVLYRWNEMVTDLRYSFIIIVCRNKRTKLTCCLNILLGMLNIDKVKKALINTIFRVKSINIVKEILTMYGIKENGDI